MILFPNTRILQAEERPVAVGATITAEGSALVADYTGGVFGVKPSTGAATEQFVGISLSQQLTPLYLPSVEELTVAALAVTVAFTVVGTPFVYNVTKSAVVAAGGAAGNYSLSGSTITIVTGGTTTNGDVLRVTYRYSPTTVQATALQGSIPAGGAAGLTLGSVGVITQGSVITSEFDSAINWMTVTASAPVRVGASGLFTVGGTGVVVPNCVVTEIPTVTSPFLGLRFTA